MDQHIGLCIADRNKLDGDVVTNGKNHKVYEHAIRASFALRNVLPREFEESSAGIRLLCWLARKNPGSKHLKFYHNPIYRFQLFDQNMKYDTIVRAPDSQLPYAYESLPSARHIRLISLQNGNDEDLIQLSMRSYSLDKAPSYIALSYTWDVDSSETNRRVTCDDSFIEVTRNLFQALQTLRKTNDLVYLWVDAMSINQKDKKERASQVQMMGEIYKKCARVWVWLGMQDENSRTALPLLHQLSKIQSEFNGNASSFEQLVQAGVPNPQVPSWKCLEAFLWRSWWSRVWVIQEICLAPDAVMYCGDYAFPAQFFFKTIAFMASSAIPTMVGINLGATPYIASLYMRMALDESRHLFDLLLDTRSYDSSDKRDKIFALLGLCNTLEASTVNPDYESSVAVTYKKHTIKMIETSKSLDILTAVCDPLWRGKPFLPSWVPDWCTHPRLTELLRYSEAIRITAAATSKAKSNAQFSADGETLILSGIILDIIGRTYRPFLFRSMGQRADVDKSNGLWTWKLQDRIPVSGMDTIMRMGLRMLMWEAAAVGSTSKSHSKLYGPTGESIMTAFLRTITGGQVMAPASKLNKASVNDSSEASKSPNGTEAVSYEINDPTARSTLEALPDSELEAYYESFCAIHLFKPRTRIMTRKDLERYSIFSKCFYRMCWGRTFAVSRKDRYLCLGPYSSRRGDVVVLLEGGKTPYLLRRKKGKGEQRWELVGECFVHGVMNGEKWDNNEQDKQIFKIV